ncbi:hypothetical protein CHS0354_010689 [Potamilus streckersoni]|uniref:Uncharacterized protein n=1 Tax=Potamilus streckersoni TaxID=2493646 RepID=A0AAE0WBM8_9BIVA|nr:hypothetical protein CHS0354_010689 [Potamilus streckersoni]
MEKKQNFYRFSALLLDVGARVLREVLTFYHLGPTTLAAYLSSNKSRLMKLRENVMTQEHLNTLFPPSGNSVLIEDIDITLLCILFRNLDSKVSSNNPVWSDPSTTDLSFQAEVGRIRVIRNFLFEHVSSASMDTSSFNIEANNLTTIFLRLISQLSASPFSSTELQQMIDKEMQGPVQPDLENRINIMRRKLHEWHQYDEDFKEMVQKIKTDIREMPSTKTALLEMQKQLNSPIKESRTVVNKRDQMKKIVSSQIALEQHRSHAEKNFVETRGYNTAKEILNQHRRLIISGKSGQGKTYLSYQLLKTMMTVDSNIKPLIISSVEEWRTLVDSNLTLGIIVDEMCGRFGLNEGELIQWKEESKYMPALLENGRHVVMFTIKSHLNQKLLMALRQKSKVSSRLFSEEISLNLDNITMQLSEKTEFVNKYLGEFRLNEHKVSELCSIHEVSIGFPQLCRAATIVKEESNVFDLFSYPREIILKQIENLRLVDRKIYACLVLVLLSEGKLDMQSIRESEASNENKENKVIWVFMSSGVSDMTSVTVQQTLESLQSTYVSLDASDGSYYFSHDSIEEAVFISHGAVFPKETLLYSSLELICKLCTIKYKSNYLDITENENMLFLQPSYQSILINRFILALKGSCPKDFAIISEANVWSCQDFRKAFVAECKEINLLADRDANSLLVHAANANNRDLVDKLLEVADQVPLHMKKQLDQFITKSAKKSCVHKDTYLLKTLCTLGGIDVTEILQSSVTHGSINAIAFLLQSGADVNFGSRDGENLLHTACLHGRTDIVKFLHSRNENLFNELDNHNRSVGHYSACGGSLESLEFFLLLGLDPTCTDSGGWNLLHYACWHANKDMVDYLMDNYPNLICSQTRDGLSILHLSAFNGNTDVLTYIIDHGIDPWCKTSQEVTLLHIACLAGQLDMTKYLVENYQTMLNEVDSNKLSAAHLAAESGNVAVLSYLINRGTDPWCRTSNGDTLLHMACIKGQLNMTKYLVETYPNMLNDFDSNKHTATHHAAESGNITVLRFLFDRGSDPWCRTSKGDTLLHMACIRGQFDITKFLVETYPKMLIEVDSNNHTAAHHAAESGNVALLSYLIDRGIDPWCRTSEGDTLLHMACLRGQLDTTKYLVETYPTMLNEVDSNKHTAAHHAALSGNVAVLIYLIDCGTDPKCTTSEGDTLLHMACMNGQFDMTKYLVEVYPNMLNEDDGHKHSAAHHAAESGNVAVLSYLIDCGTNPWCRTSEGDTLLHIACLKGQLDTTKYLVETYPDMLNEVDSNKHTAAHHAAESGNVSVLSYLIDRGSDPWCKTSKGDTLLHMACMNGRLDMTKYLVEAYPKMLIEVDSNNHTAAHDAALSGNVAVLVYLIDRGSDPWCTTSEGDTLLHMACMDGQLDMTKYLVETYPDMLNDDDIHKHSAAHHAAVSGNVAVLSYLIDRGTDPWCRTSEGEILLHISCLAGQLDMTKYLVETYPNMLNEVDIYERTVTHHAALSGNVAVLKYLIDRGRDPWCITSQNASLLHISCHAGQLDMTKFLVEIYPNMLNEVDINKHTAAHDAAESGNIAVLRFLIDRGIDPWCRTSQEATLLHRACLTGQLDMTKYLVETYPYMLNEFDSHKHTAAHYAAVSGNIAVLNYLIDRGTDPWCRTFQEETLLHIACLEGHLDMTKCLIETYPDMLNEVDSHKQTAAHYAAVSGNIAVLSYLIDRGTDPYCRTSQEETLLHIACLDGHLDMIKYLVETYPNMLNSVDSNKLTAVHYATKSGDVAVLSYLLDHNQKGIVKTP